MVAMKQKKVNIVTWYVELLLHDTYAIKVFPRGPRPDHKLSETASSC